MMVEMLMMALKLVMTNNALHNSTIASTISPAPQKPCAISPNTLLLSLYLNISLIIIVARPPFSFNFFKKLHHAPHSSCRSEIVGARSHFQRLSIESRPRYTFMLLGAIRNTVLLNILIVLQNDENVFLKSNDVKMAAKSFSTTITSNGY